VVEGSYLVGPMSVPSKSRNLTSIGSFPPAISSPPDRRRPAAPPPLSKIHEAPDQRTIAATKRRKKSTETRARWDFDDEFLLPRGVKARGRRPGGGREEDETKARERETG
jgi:hypothetical protein